MKFNTKSKKTLTFLLLGVFAMAMATAGIIQYFGSVEQEVEVKQGLSIDGNSYNQPVTDSLGEIYSNTGGTSIKAHSLQNDAGEDSEVLLERTDCLYEGDYSGNSCGDITTSYYDYSKKTFDLVVAGDTEEKSFGDLQVTANPTKDTVVYKAEVPTDYFDRNDHANLNFQVSLTDSDSEDNFQVTYYPSQSNWDWKFMSPSVSKDVKVYGESNVTALDEVVSVEHIDKTDSPDVIKVVLNKPEAQQSFGVQATDGGEGYKAISTEGFSFANQATDSHKLVAEKTSTMTVPAEGSVDFAVFNEYPEGTVPGNYTITSKVSLA